MFNSDAVDAFIREEAEPEDIALAAGLLPSMNLSVAIDLISQADGNSSRTKRKEVEKSNETIIDYDGLEPVKSKAKLPFKPRERTKRVPKEESHWYRKYLSPAKRSIIDEQGETLI